MEEGKVAKRIKQKRQRVETHARKNKERKDEAQQTKMHYFDEKDGPVLTDLLKKARGFHDYHVKIAKDGVGTRATGELYENKTPVMETFFLTPSNRLRELDKSAGIQEIIDYIERQVASEVPQPAVDDTSTEDEETENIEDVAEDPNADNKEQ